MLVQKTVNKASLKLLSLVLPLAKKGILRAFPTFPDNNGSLCQNCTSNVAYAKDLLLRYEFWYMLGKWCLYD